MLKQRSIPALAGVIFSVTTTIYMSAYYASYLMITNNFSFAEMYLILPLIFLLAFGTIFSLTGYLFTNNAYYLLGAMLTLAGSLLLFPFNSVLITYIVIFEFYGYYDIAKQSRVKVKETQKVD